MLCSGSARKKPRLCARPYRHLRPVENNLTASVLPTKTAAVICTPCKRLAGNGDALFFGRRRRGTAGRITITRPPCRGAPDRPKTIIYPTAYSDRWSTLSPARARTLYITRTAAATESRCYVRVRWMRYTRWRRVNFPWRNAAVR